MPGHLTWCCEWCSVPSKANDPWNHRSTWPQRQTLRRTSGRPNDERNVRWGSSIPPQHNDSSTTCLTKKFRDVRWWSSIPPQQKDRMIHTRQLFSYYMPHKKIQRCHSDISAKPEQQTLMDWTDFKRQLFFIPKLNDLWISSVIKKPKSHDDLYT